MSSGIAAPLPAGWPGPLDPRKWESLFEDFSLKITDSDLIGSVGTESWIVVDIGSGGVYAAGEEAAGRFGTLGRSTLRCSEGTLHNDGTLIHLNIENVGVGNAGFLMTPYRDSILIGGSVRFYNSTIANRDKKYWGFGWSDQGVDGFDVTAEDWITAENYALIQKTPGTTGSSDLELVVRVADTERRRVVLALDLEHQHMNTAQTVDGIDKNPFELELRWEGAKEEYVAGVNHGMLKTFINGEERDRWISPYSFDAAPAGGLAPSVACVNAIVGFNSAKVEADWIHWLRERVAPGDYDDYNALLA